MKKARGEKQEVEVVLSNAKSGNSEKNLRVFRN
jgi:hypothetical protein